MTDPLLTPAELTATTGALILDATVDLPRPTADGDHRATSGEPGWAARHLPGARHLDLLHAFADPDAGFHFAQPTRERAHRVLTALGARDGRPVVVYDRSDGFWAARAWWSLRALGLTARVLDGGLAAWVAAGGALARGRSARPAAAHGPLTLTPRPELWASLSDVRAVADGRAPGRLVCALGTEQFDGTAPTRYTRRGHIPGSLNLPARRLIGPAGTLRHPDLAGVVGGLPAEPLVLYCGGGISASFLALGLVAAGTEEVRIYDGSLEEWSARPELPLAVS